MIFKFDENKCDIIKKLDALNDKIFEEFYGMLYGDEKITHNIKTTELNNFCSDHLFHLANIIDSPEKIKDFYSKIKEVKKKTILYSAHGSSLSNNNIFLVPKDTYIITTANIDNSSYVGYNYLLNTIKSFNSFSPTELTKQIKKLKKNNNTIYKNLHRFKLHNPGKTITDIILRQHSITQDNIPYPFLNDHGMYLKFYDENLDKMTSPYLNSYLSESYQYKDETGAVFSLNAITLSSLVENYGPGIYVISACRDDSPLMSKVLSDNNTSHSENNNGENNNGENNNGENNNGENNNGENNNGEKINAIMKKLIKKTIKRGLDTKRAGIFKSTPRTKFTKKRSNDINKFKDQYNEYFKIIYDSSVSACMDLLLYEIKFKQIMSNIMKFIGSLEVYLNIFFIPTEYTSFNNFIMIYILNSFNNTSIYDIYQYYIRMLLCLKTVKKEQNIEMNENIYGHINDDNVNVFDVFLKRFNKLMHNSKKYENNNNNNKNFYSGIKNENNYLILLFKKYIFLSNKDEAFLMGIIKENNNIQKLENYYNILILCIFTFLKSQKNHNFNLDNIDNIDSLIETKLKKNKEYVKLEDSMDSEFKKIIVNE